MHVSLKAPKHLNDLKWYVNVFVIKKVQFFDTQTEVIYMISYRGITINMLNSLLCDMQESSIDDIGLMHVSEKPIVLVLFVKSVKST